MPNCVELIFLYYANLAWSNLPTKVKCGPCSSNYHRCFSDEQAIKSDKLFNSLNVSSFCSSCGSVLSKKGYLNSIDIPKYL